MVILRYKVIFVCQKYTFSFEKKALRANIAEIG